jgi:hypothetical protein
MKTKKFAKAPSNPWAGSRAKAMTFVQRLYAWLAFLDWPSFGHQTLAFAKHEGQPTTPKALPAQIHVLRTQMLKLLHQPADSVQANLRQRIAQAPNADTLWYLRPSLLTALSEHHGELRALELIRELDWLFKGLVSTAMEPLPKLFQS